MDKTKPQIAIIMGSDSDLTVMKHAVLICKEFGIPFEIIVSSAHRTPGDVAEFASTAKNRGIKVIIAGAGGAAHLPGVIAGHTTLPVIGVPIMTKTLNGLDSLYSIVQMPPGVPVATVGIDAAKNAGILAVQIIAAGDEELQSKLVSYKEKLAAESRKKNENPEIAELRN